VKNRLGLIRGIVIGAALLLIALASHGVQQGLAQDAKVQSTIEKAFPSSSKCKRCHERVFEEWETSPLARSIHTPTFRAALDAYLASPAGKDKALCFRCHAPHVREFAEQAQVFVTQAQSGEPSLDGVACAQCHLIKQVESDEAAAGAEIRARQ